MERLGDVLRRWIAESGDAAGVSGLFQGWGDVVGPDLAAHTRPIEVERGRLIVAADHPGWVQLLRTQERAILRRLGRSHPALEIGRIVTVLRDPFDSGER